MTNLTVNEDGAFGFYHSSIDTNRAMQGYRITFSNGYILSVAFGYGNYGDQGKTTAETAIIAPNDGNFIEYKGDQVQGHQSPEDVAATMAYVATL